MIEATAAAILVVGPPSDPLEFIVSDTGNGVRLPRRLVDYTGKSIQEVAEDLAKDCPAVDGWEFTTWSEQYSYGHTGPELVRYTVHAFLVAATERGRERNGYRWMPLADHSSESMRGRYAIQEFKRVLDQGGFDDLGVDVASVSDDFEMSAEARAEKINQDTTLTDF